MTYDVQALREREFRPATAPGVIYLNHGSTGPLPARAVEALSRFNALRAEPHRISHEEQFGVLDDARERCARLINADPRQVALMVNTGYGINLAARALPLEHGDVIVAPDREFPANVYPWMALAPRGIRLELIPCVDELPDEDALLRAIERPDVRVCAVSWVSFATGARVDLKRLGAACRAHGTYLVVDAIQGLGPLTLDVRKCEIDILACGAQKWLLSPWGTGFVYLRDELVTELEPVDVSWFATRSSQDFSRLLAYDPTPLDDARRFEMITLPFQDFAGMSASLDLLLELGPTQVEQHIRSLCDRIVSWAESTDGVRLVTPAAPERRAGIVSVAPAYPDAASARLSASGVVHSLREGAIRLSPHCYNTIDDIDEATRLLVAAR
jgi:cysteine desulfurase / selenocysteine lyase